MIRHLVLLAALIVLACTAHLSAAESIKLDVGNKEGDSLVILELTQDQRERAKE